ncbi:hypothetical protein MKX08_000415 [Trichoderma sp. CBMAI-0020]|nr:hypothetical protein MKX08_000415 [Trichoderma sp. CBMAI-0020]
MARSALSADVQLLSHGGFADVQVSRHACPVEHRDGMPGTTITTHPTHPTVAHSAGPAKREDNPAKIATGKRVKMHTREWKSDPLRHCL